MYTWDVTLIQRSVSHVNRVARYLLPLHKVTLTKKPCIKLRNTQRGIQGDVSRHSGQKSLLICANQYEAGLARSASYCAVYYIRSDFCLQRNSIKTGNHHHSLTLELKGTKSSSQIYKDASHGTCLDPISVVPFLRHDDNDVKCVGGLVLIAYMVVNRDVSVSQNRRQPCQLSRALNFSSAPGNLQDPFFRLKIHIM